jgi:hypothetical protein
MAYAENTTVPVEKSFSEMVTLLRKAGADRIAQMQGSDGFSIQFELSDRMIRFTLPVPLWTDMPKHNGRNQTLTDDKRQTLADRVAMSRARALLLVVKAKLESVESEIETFEQAFLANVVMPDGKTVYERISEPLALEYRAGRPSMLLLGGAA